MNLEQKSCNCDEQYRILRLPFMVIGFIIGLASPIVMLVTIGVLDPQSTLSWYSFGVWTLGIILFILTLKIAFKVMYWIIDRTIKCTCNDSEGEG